MNETVPTLAELWDGVPIPAGSWHPGADEIRRLDSEVRAALAVAGEDDAVAGELERLVESGAAPPQAAGTGRAAEARRLLAGLPRPEGRHPYLDEIVPALEAADLLFAAIGASTDGRTRFERLSAREPAATTGS